MQIFLWRVVFDSEMSTSNVMKSKLLFVSMLLIFLLLLFEGGINFTWIQNERYFPHRIISKSKLPTQIVFT